MKLSPLAVIGAACYVIWGLLHLAAAASVYELGAAMPFAHEQGRVLQDAWYIFFSAVTGIGVGAVFNWRNSVWGYWVNLGVISVADVGFLLFVMLPGHVEMWPAILGPIFWIAGALFTTAAIVRHPRTR